ncbi:MAG: hypothetical protein V1723_02100 [Candidatus Uhrbacteria bacterium]
MAKHHEHGLAVALRQQGQSYSEIKRALGVSKGTLSRWLEDLPLSANRVRELRDWNQKRIERYRETRRKTREAILEHVYRIMRRRVLPLTKRDLFLGGLFLYWGEGSKTKWNAPSLSNSDPVIVRFFVTWVIQSLGIDRQKIRVRLHCYSDMDVQRERRYWSRAIGIPLVQFGKTYVKESTRSALSYKGGFGHGTCNVIVNNAAFGRSVIMGLRVLREQFEPQDSTGQ